ncbi:MAG TPA: hypothetical protein VGH02_14900 [Rhizomicrobium sp.]|jgi:outer membrane protein assembly factor BamE (lipoprotein component of BamABCDE complex)
MKSLAVAAALSAFALTGCATGTSVSKDESAQFQKGVTTEQQVLAALGAPNGKAELINGGRRDIYVYESGGPNPVDYVPLLALAAQSGYEHTTTVNFDFNAQGVLVDVSRYRERM